MILENDIKLKTAVEARKDAEVQAKVSSVVSMSTAASILVVQCQNEGTAATVSGDHQDPDAVNARVNGMLE